METFKLVYVEEIGRIDGEYEYEFYFSDKPDEFWGVGFDTEFASQEEIQPDIRYCGKILRLRTEIPFLCAQKNRCFSMRHAVDGIISIAFEDITYYDEYPEPYRIVFHYGEDLQSVISKLDDRNIKFID